MPGAHHDLQRHTNMAWRSTAWSGAAMRCARAELPINLVTKLAVLHRLGGRLSSPCTTGAQEMSETRAVCVACHAHGTTQGDFLPRARWQRHRLWTDDVYPQEAWVGFRGRGTGGQPADGSTLGCDQEREELKRGRMGSCRA
jgi:hypothetical protein